MALAACGGAGGEQWTPASGGAVTNGAGGGACLALNVVDDVTHEPGNPVVAYTCADPPQWNDIWSLPAAGTEGPLIAHDKSGAVSNLCLSAPDASPLDWSLPWHDAWSLRDF